MVGRNRGGITMVLSLQWLISMVALTLHLSGEDYKPFNNYGAFLEKDGGGLRGPIKLTGCKMGMLVLASRSGLT
ncbi:hypothetical protein ACH5RR_032682, partial [Cinchona calisaya]